MQILALTPDRQFTPKYVDVARDLMREMASGPMAIGDRLGTEQEISGRYNVGLHRPQARTRHLCRTDD
jgi:DNA-binding GntR family transcriptional regulator